MNRIVIILFTVFLSGYTVKSQNLIHEFGGNHMSTTSISFTSDGKYMITGGYARLYELAEGRLDFRTIEKDTETQDDVSYKVAVNGDNSTFLVARINRIDIWDLRSRTLMRTIRDSRMVMKTACFSTDGRYLMYMRKNGEIVIVNTSTYAESLVKKITNLAPAILTAAPDGKKILVGTKSNIIVIFDLSTEEINPYTISDQDILNITFPASGNMVAASTSEGRIWMGRFPSMEIIKSWQAHTAGITDISFHPDGKYLASGGKDKMIRVWNIPDGSVYAEWSAHKSPVLALAFSPDGLGLASGGQFEGFLRRGDDTRFWSFGAPQQQIKYAAKESPQPTPSASAPPKMLSITATGQKRLALVIGNGNYTGSVLANPENDARAMKEALEQYGFDVIKHENLDQNQMKRAMDEFGERLRKYDVGLFFYAGHGIQSKGYNYLVPVDADLRSEEQVEYDCVQADRVLALMEASAAKVNIIILDACRNNPFERSWTRAASGRGLAYMNAPSGTLIAYATAPGSTASDGSGQNGLYTSAILESIKIPDISILQMFQNVRGIVSQQSNKQQIPWESTSLTGDFFFFLSGNGAK